MPGTVSVSEWHECIYCFNYNRLLYGVINEKNDFAQNTAESSFTGPRQAPNLSGWNPLLCDRPPDLNEAVNLDQAAKRTIRRFFDSTRLKTSFANR
jgi:hypothetical protein